MAEMGIAMGRADFGTHGEQRSVRLLVDVRRLEPLREARPPGAGLELVERAEQRLPRHDVHVDPGLVVVPELVCERPLGGVVLGHLVLQRSQRAPQLGVARLLEMHRAPSLLAGLRAPPPPPPPFQGSIPAAPLADGLLPGWLLGDGVLAIPPPRGKRAP